MGETRERTADAAERKVPVGAEVLAGGGVHFRVWAPSRRKVDVVLDGGATFALAAEDGAARGYFSARVPSARAGTRYRYRLDGDALLPDPASRFQPEGPHGPSEVVDARAFAWTDGAWKGLSPRGQVLYELHIGTFTREGTYEAAIAELPRLVDLGITAIELMPVADFPGTFGWGYDGVNLFAPSRLYGAPDDLRRLVDAAHRLGLGVILDVVYNHFGPDGNYLGAYSRAYVTDRYANEWGDAINFDGDDAAPVREYFIANAAYWVDEFHFDGLRLDATQCIHDGSCEHVIAALGRAAREAAHGRGILLIAENESQEARLARPVSRGGMGLDGLWNDDFHHSAITALTGQNPAYYSDTRGTPQELLSAVKWGYLYQGQRYAWQKNRRGSAALDLPATAFVSYLENHDQVANSGKGERLAARTTPGRLRAMTALWLLAPATPLFFQGQEYGAHTPFLFFADHGADLARQVRTGRADFLAQFPALASEGAKARLDDPAARATFDKCKLDGEERARRPELLALHRDLLRLRRGDPAFAAQDRDRVFGAVIGPEALALRFLCDDGDRLLLVNFGRDLREASIAEPLLAPPEGAAWAVLWSSEDVAYGGPGVAAFDDANGVDVPGHAALVLHPVPRPAPADAKEGQ